MNAISSEMTPSLNQLVEEGKWTEAQQVVGAMESSHLVLNSFKLAKSKPNVPSDFLRAVASRLLSIAAHECMTLISQLEASDSPAVYSAVLSVVPKCNQLFPSIEWLKAVAKQKTIDIWSTFLCDTDKPGQMKEASLQQILSVSTLEDLDAHHDLLSVWQKTSTLAIFSSCVNINGPKLPILHAVAELGGPTIIMFLAMKFYPFQLGEKDQQGRNPIHILASQPLNENLRGIKFTEDLKIANLSMIECVLQVCPECRLFEDGDGNLPLTIAAMHDETVFRKLASPDVHLNLVQKVKYQEKQLNEKEDKIKAKDQLIQRLRKSLERIEVEVASARK
jgi:hypothetical protein